MMFIAQHALHSIMNRFIWLFGVHGNNEVGLNTVHILCLADVKSWHIFKAEHVQDIEVIS